MEKPDLLVIAGPTASGKSELALELAAALNTEIVSGDSMQFYRGLDIGTAKPSAADRRRAPHHLIDCLDISERMDVFRFVYLASSAIAAIGGRGRLPCVVGGTGLYLRSLIYGIDDLPADPALRAELELRYPGNEQLPELRAALAALDPETSARWPTNRRRLLRALEVATLSGRTVADFRRGEREPRYHVLTLIPEWDRDELKRRIAARTSAMLDAGWIDEARRMFAAGLAAAPTARQALGYDLIGEHLAGRIDRHELEATIAVRTWQLARRQLTWFRHQHPEAEWLPTPVAPAQAEERVRKFFKNYPAEARN